MNPFFAINISGKELQIEIGCYLCLHSNCDLVQTVVFVLSSFLCFERTKVSSPKNIVIPLADIAKLEKVNKDATYLSVYILFLLYNINLVHLHLSGLLFVTSGLFPSECCKT